MNLSNERLKGSHRSQPRQWRFLFLFGTLLLLLVAEPILFGIRVKYWVFDLFYSLMLIATTVAFTRGNRQARRLVIALGIVLTFTWGTQVLTGRTFEWGLGVRYASGIIFLTYAVWSTVRALFASHRITLDSVFGSLAGYLMLGMIWAMIFSLVHVVSPDSFHIPETWTANTGRTFERLPLFNYFSFVTLTTLGYGDITPQSQSAQTLAWTAAVTGQFYMATLVAWIVGKTGMLPAPASARTDKKGSPVGPASDKSTTA